MKTCKRTSQQRKFLYSVGRNKKNLLVTIAKYLHPVYFLQAANVSLLLSTPEMLNFTLL